MKYLYALRISAIILFFSSCIFTVKANNIGAGELNYEHISDSTYRITVKIYWVCSGLSEPATMPLCVSNSCVTNIITTSLIKQSATPEIPFPCPSYPSKCTTPSSTIPGYKLLSYTTNITLPSQCNSWKFYTYYDHRDATLNFSSPGNSIFYTESVFNNIGSFQGNSSPTTLNNNILYTCQFTPFSYNSGAIDPNGDSLATELVSVLTNTNSCNGSPINQTLASKTPTLNITTNPFQTNNTFNCNALTGQVSFTPQELGSQVIAIRIKEYRNGVLIGSIMKDIRYNILNCSSYPNITPTITSLVNCTNNAGIINACRNQLFSFTVDIKSSDITSVLSATDNHTSATPGASIMYSIQNRDSIRATFSWIAPVTSPIINNLVFIIKDSSCKPPGIVYYKGIQIPINLAGKPIASPDTTICSGQNASLSVIGGGNYTWAVLPGGTVGSLSCTNCANPIAAPNITTSYEVTSAASSSCGNNKDTVTVTVLPNITPMVSITANPGTVISSGTTITFTATPANCSSAIYSWKRNGTLITSGPSNTFATSIFTNLDKISCEMTCYDKCATPKKTSSQDLTISLLSSINNLENSSNCSIYPNPNNGIFTITSNNQNTEYYNLEVINSMGQSVYNKKNVKLGNSIQQKIDLSYLPAGIYALRLNDIPYIISIRK